MPNVLTCLRIALAPVLVAVVLIAPDEWVAAAAVFVVAAVTDALDGAIARARNCVSAFGVAMDPVADKLLVCSALGALVAIGRAPVWLLAIVVARELAVSALRAAAARHAQLIPAGPLGKVKMALQVATVVAVMAAGAGSSAVQALMVFTAAVTVASGIDYFVSYRRGRGGTERVLVPATLGRPD